MLPDLLVDHLFERLVRDCQRIAKIDLTEMDCGKLAEEFPNLPVVCLFSRTDELVTASDSMNIFAKLKTNFKLFVDSKAKHDQVRPEKHVRRVFLFMDELQTRVEKNRARKRKLRQRLLQLKKLAKGKKKKKGNGKSKRKEDSSRLSEKLKRGKKKSRSQAKELLQEVKRGVPPNRSGRRHKVNPTRIKSFKLIPEFLSISKTQNRSLHQPQSSQDILLPRNKKPEYHPSLMEKNLQVRKEKTSTKRNQNGRTAPRRDNPDLFLKPDSRSLYFSVLGTKSKPQARPTLVNGAQENSTFDGLGPNHRSILVADPLMDTKSVAQVSQSHSRHPSAYKPRSHLDNQVSKGMHRKLQLLATQPRPNKILQMRQEKEVQKLKKRLDTPLQKNKVNMVSTPRNLSNNSMLVEEKKVVYLNARRPKVIIRSAQQEWLNRSQRVSVSPSPFEQKRPPEPWNAKPIQTHLTNYFSQQAPLKKLSKNVRKSIGLSANLLPIKSVSKRGANLPSQRLILHQPVLSANYNSSHAREFFPKKVRPVLDPTGSVRPPQRENPYGSNRSFFNATHERRERKVSYTPQATRQNSAKPPKQKMTPSKSQKRQYRKPVSSQKPKGVILGNARPASGQQYVQYSTSYLSNTSGMSEPRVFNLRPARHTIQVHYRQPSEQQRKKAFFTGTVSHIFRH